VTCGHYTELTLVQTELQVVARNTHTHTTWIISSSWC